MKQKKNNEFENINPQKSLGQNFLINKEVINNITEKIKEICKSDCIVEIGPGPGALTFDLFKFFADKLYMIELDENLFSNLQKSFSDIKNNIFNEDFLKFDLENFFKDKKISVVGNIPYNISSAILFKLLQQKKIVENICFTVQKEVAERVCASPKSKSYGVPSILIQNYYKTNLEFEIKNSDFFPIPKVQSAFIVLQRNKVEKIDCDEKNFNKIVKQAFSQRRKTLKNSLKGLFSKDILEKYENKRAEELSIAEFIELTKKYE